MSMSPAWRADLYLLLATFLAALGWIFSKEVLNALAPLLFLGLRFLIGGLLLLPFAWPSLRVLTRADFQRILRISLVFTLALVLWMYGLAHTQHLGVGAFLNTLAIVLVPIISIAYGERPSFLVWLALPVTILGMALLFLESHFALNLGEIIFLVAAVLFAFSFVFTSHAAAGLPVIALTALQLMIVGGVSLGLSAVIDEWTFQQAPNIWGWLLLSIVIATSARFLIQIKGQALAPASHAVLILTLEPVWVAIVAAIWFGERMTLLQILGCILIFCAVLLSRWRAILQLLKA